MQPTNPLKCVRESVWEIKGSSGGHNPPKHAIKWSFSSCEPSRAIQVPTSSILRAVNSVMTFIPINQALGHLQMRFSGSRSTQFPFIQHSLQLCQKWVFDHVSPAGQFRYPQHRFLVALACVDFPACWLFVY